ncbi:HI1506-related protein [Frederiksenia canicola]
MEKVTELFEVLVQNRVAEGYRRAGFALQKGENQLRGVTAEQLAQIKADIRLAVSHAAPMVADGQALSQGLSQDDKGQQGEKSVGGSLLPATLTVEQLKAKLTELGIAFKPSAHKPELIALLEAALSAEKNNGGE